MFLKQQSFILVLCSLLTFNAYALDIAVYYTDADKLVYSAEKLDGHSVRYHNLSIVSQIENKLSVNLPNNQKSAQPIASSRLSDTDKRQAHLAWAALIKVKLLGIQYLPAIVFNDVYVFYGSDLRLAKSKYDSVIRASK